VSRYFAHISATCPVRGGQGLGLIRVLEAPDQAPPIGMVFEVGWTEGGLAVWRLTMRGADLTGRWEIVDRNFQPVEESQEDPRLWS
jgi:hypothetical protein